MKNESIYKLYGKAWKEGIIPKTFKKGQFELKEYNVHEAILFLLRMYSQLAELIPQLGTIN